MWGVQLVSEANVEFVDPQDINKSSRRRPRSSKKGWRDRYSRKGRQTKRRAQSRGTHQRKKVGNVGKGLKTAFTPGSTACLILCLLILVLIGWLVFQGAHIYASLGRRVGESALIDWGRLGAGAVESWSIPFVSWLLSRVLWVASDILHSLQITVYGLGFILIFLLLQTGEIAPTAIRNSPALSRSIISSLRSFKKIKTQQGDSRFIAGMVDDYNTYYEKFMFNLRVAQFICFLVDGAICISSAPFIKGGWGQWESVRFSYNVWADTDWTNVMRASIAVFFLWLACWCFFQVRRGVRIFSGKVNND